MSTLPLIRIQSQGFSLVEEMTRLTSAQPDVGAVVTFTGLCRGDAGRLAALELEHYPGMAEPELIKAAEEACLRWPLTGLTAIHRYGLVKPGEEIVLVITASAHRAAAFAGAEFMMDYLKTRAPFWKREHLVDGTTGGWVEAKDADDASASRWNIQDQAHDKN